MNRRRMSTFSLPEHLLYEKTDDVKRLMSQVIVVRCEYNWAMSCFDYTVQSDLIPETPLGSVYPKLSLGFNEDGSLELRWVDGKAIIHSRPTVTKPAELEWVPPPIHDPNRKPG